MTAAKYFALLALSIAAGSLVGGLRNIHDDLQGIKLAIELHHDSSVSPSIWPTPFVLDAGRAQGATRDTLTLRDGAKFFIDDTLTGATCVITGGAGVGQARLVTQQKGNVVTVFPWTTIPAGDITYSCFATVP